MDCKTKKYLHIYDWNYWWGYYRCGKDWEPFHAAEFSLSEDEAGEAPFFHFDFHNLSALHQTIRDGEFVEPDNPDHPHFLEQARRLRSGEQDWFVGALYYPLFSPEMHFCNASVRSGVPLTQLLSPSVPPYYGVIFLREERPLTPEVLTHWAETLSQPLFGQPFSCTLAQVPSRQEAMEQFENPKTYCTKPGDKHRYLTEEEFNAQDFFEKTRYAGIQYGTKMEDIEAVLAKGHFVVMPLDMCGAIAMKRHFPTVIVYVARDKELLIRDIIEQDYSIEEKTLRILSIDAEKRNRQICDYAVNNMDVGAATRELSDVLENNCL